MSMPTLLKKLTKHTKAQTRDALRMQVSAYNGLAGLHILKDDVCLIVHTLRTLLFAGSELVICLSFAKNCTRKY